jgi:ribosomal protein L37AE/L43A
MTGPLRVHDETRYGSMAGPPFGARYGSAIQRYGSTTGPPIGLYVMVLLCHVTGPRYGSTLRIHVTGPLRVGPRYGSTLQVQVMGPRFGWEYRQWQ